MFQGGAAAASPGGPGGFDGENEISIRVGLSALLGGFGDICRVAERKRIEIGRDDALQRWP